MTNEHEKRWQELVEKETRDLFIMNEPFSTYAMKQEIEVFHHAVNWTRANLSQLPEVRELIEEIRTLKDTKWFNPITNQWEPTVSVYRANKLLEALKSWGVGNEHD